jgi:CubicO group peptidase (beta-lactamase class C family)
MSHTLAALAFAASLPLASARAAEGPRPPAATASACEARLDAFVARGMRDWKVPGLAVVVVQDGAVVYQKGFGVRRLGAEGAVDPDTLFGMMSTTKAMTALAVAMLVDEGKLRWDDPVAKHLPWFRLPNAYLTEHVTVRDALRHSAGVAGADLLWAREDLGTREVLERMRLVPATASLRSEWVYQNVMYQAAGEVVAAASGLPWDRFVARRILEPLGMTRSFPTWDAVAAAREGNVSSPHFEIDGVVRAIDEVAVDRVPAAGATWTTARDAGKWLAFLLAGGQAGGKRLVSEEAFVELLAPQVVIAPASRSYPTTKLVGSRWTTYGLGWFQQDYRGRFVAMHTGSMDGRTAIVGLVPEERLGVFAFSNLDHAELRHALLWQVIDLWTGAPERDWNAECLKLYGEVKAKAKKAEADREAARVPGTKPSHALDAYGGTYAHPAWGRVEIALERGALVLRIGPSPRLAGTLEPWHYDTFRVRLGDGREGFTYLGFATGVDGKVASLTLGDEGAVFTREAAAKAP